jgi:phage replication-related protein YjqB (UPF0714/DUF867 family)
MTALYADPQNIAGVTYAKRWLRHEWRQLVEEQADDNPETDTIVLAIHGGGIEAGTSELALAVAGLHPATLVPAADGLGAHDVWLFEGLLGTGNGRLHVTASNYDDPIATELVQNSRRCISLHGCTDAQAKGKVQVGGLDCDLRALVLEELAKAGIAAQRATDPLLDGSLPDNIGNKTTVGGCAQLEMGTSFRRSLFGINTRPGRKRTTTAAFWRLVGALRMALHRL